MMSIEAQLTHTYTFPFNKKTLRKEQTKKTQIVISSLRPVHERGTEFLILKFIFKTKTCSSK